MECMAVLYTVKYTFMSITVIIKLLLEEWEDHIPIDIMSWDGISMKIAFFTTITWISMKIDKFR